MRVCAQKKSDEGMKIRQDLLRGGGDGGGGGGGVFRDGGHTTPVF